MKMRVFIRRDRNRMRTELNFPELKKNVILEAESTYPVFQAGLMRKVTGTHPRKVWEFKG